MKKIFSLACLGFTGFVLYMMFSDSPAEATAKAEQRTRFDQCWHENSTSDSKREATAMAVEFEYHRIGKSYLLQGKTDDDKIYMFCDATSKKVMK